MSEQQPNTTPEQSQAQLPALDEKYKSYLENIADTSLTVVRAAGSEEQRLESGWHVTDKIEYFEGSDIPWVTVANYEGEKRVRIDALMHYNPLEQEATSEQHVAPETVQELGHEAVAETMEAGVPAEQDEDHQNMNKEHLDALKTALVNDVYALRDIVKSGDLSYLNQYISVFGQKISELRQIDAGSQIATNLDGAVQTLRSQISVDMNNSQIMFHAYNQVLDDIEQEVHKIT